MFKINERHKGIEYKNKYIDNIGYKRIAIIMLNEFLRKENLQVRYVFSVSLINIIIICIFFISKHHGNFYG